MLTELRIRDFAVIRDLELELGPGFTALTGETGAGKSIIVGALALLLGGRASPEAIRSGADRARIDGTFSIGRIPALQRRLEELGMAGEGDLLMLSREVQAEGRSRGWINGFPATAALLGEIGGAIVEIHGQHDHQRLVRPEEQGRILDAWSGSSELVEELGRIQAEVRALDRALQDEASLLRHREARRGELDEEIKEIESVAPVEGEEEELDRELALLDASEELLAGLRAAAEGIHSGEDALTDRLARYRDLLRPLGRVDPALSALLPDLDSIYHGLVEAGRGLEDRASRIDPDPVRAERIRDRLGRLSRLRRKLGRSIPEILQRLDELRRERDGLEEGLPRREAREQHRLERIADRDALALRVSDAREDGGERLTASVGAILPRLGLPGGTFHVLLTPSPEDRTGVRERIEFLISPNPGLEPRPLARVASGGELSRIMLALKSALVAVDPIPTLLFDEIDAGVGGEVALGLADHLAGVGDGHQVLVITHLPQVAAAASRQIRVVKEDDAGRTVTRVESLDPEARVAEIARMLGGDSRSEIARKHARELLGRRHRGGAHLDTEGGPG